MGCPTLPASECEDPNSDWYAFMTSPVVADPKRTSRAARRRRPRLLGALPAGFRSRRERAPRNALRLSIEWSRIFPTATDGADGYAALKAIASPTRWRTTTPLRGDEGARPHAAGDAEPLHAAIVDPRRGRLPPTSPRAPRAAGSTPTGRSARSPSTPASWRQEFGGEVDCWATLNEPLRAWCWPATSSRRPSAPTRRRCRSSSTRRRPSRRAIDAHARMYDAVKADDTVDADGDGQASQVGLVYALAPEPANPTRRRRHRRRRTSSISGTWSS